MQATITFTKSIVITGLPENATQQQIDELAEIVRNSSTPSENDLDNAQEEIFKMDGGLGLSVVEEFEIGATIVVTAQEE